MLSKNSKLTLQITTAVYAERYEICHDSPDGAAAASTAESQPDGGACMASCSLCKACTQAAPKQLEVTDKSSDCCPDHCLEQTSKDAAQLDGKDCQINGTQKAVGRTEITGMSMLERISKCTLLAYLVR